MCDPFSIAVTSAAVGAGGSIMQGMSAKRTADANAAALRVNADRREMKADFDIERTERQFQTQQGALRARIALSGITQGSFSDLIAADASERAMQVAGIEWSAQNDVDNLNFQASAAENQGRNAMTAGFINAAGSVVSSVGGYYKSAGLGATKSVSLDTAFTTLPSEVPNRYAGYGNYTY